LFEEQVVTAGARASSEAKAPASLTVISEDEIRMSGATTLPEILRRVPGIDMAEMNPSDTNISIRGFNRRVANKVLVPAGGRSGKVSYRTTVAYDRADKWTKDAADGAVDLTPQFSQPNRSREVERADMALTWDGGKAQVQAGGGFDNMAIEIVPLGALRS